MPNTKPPVDSEELVRFLVNREAAVKVSPIACITKGQGGHELTDFTSLIQAGATGFSDDGNRLAVTYGKSCTATYDRKSGMLRVENGGIPIAIGTDRFVPVDGGILAYSKSGGEQKWQLPANWRGAPLLWELTAGGRKPGPKCRLEGRSVIYLAAPGRPYLITDLKEGNR
jgi:hypothetical protein